MELTYKELLAAQLKFGTTEEDIRSKEDFNMVLPNVVIAPWWEIEMFMNSDLKITKISERMFSLANDEVEFSFIQVKQIGAPAIIEEVLSLGVTKCENLVFVGSAGALVENIGIGDIVVPKLSICGDGASRYLNSDLKDDFGQKAKPDSRLTAQLFEAAEKIAGPMNVKTHQVDNFSVDTIFGQFPHMDTIIGTGAKVIEMETYSLFKAAKIAGIKATALFCISDNIINKKTLYSGRTEEEAVRRRMVRNNILPNIIIDFFKNI